MRLRSLEYADKAPVNCVFACDQTMDVLVIVQCLVAELLVRACLAQVSGFVEDELAEFVDKCGLSARE